MTFTPFAVLTLALSCLTAAALHAQARPDMQAILLGTGYPIPDPERAGPATAVVVNRKVFLVDAGRAVTMRMAAAGYRTKDVTAVFLTHLHSDHTVGLPDVFTTSWIRHRSAPLELYGPSGTRQLADSILKFLAADIHIRRDLTEALAPAGARFNVHLVRQGVVYQDADVKVTAFAVDHEPVTPAFGYKFESNGKTIVISGDTAPSENLVRYAQGADVLIHEADIPDYFDNVDSPQVAARLKRYHTTAEQAGEVAARARARMLVLTHLVPGNEPERMLKDAGKHYSGKIVVGRDLMQF